MARTIGSRVGKNPSKTVNIELNQTKYKSGGSKIRRKKGGIVRRPRAMVRNTKAVKA